MPSIIRAVLAAAWFLSRRAITPFIHNIVIPTGVTLHGDWQDWTKGNGGLVGTTFKVYFGAGQANGTPFITLDNSTALRDVNIWYPEPECRQHHTYPFSIGLNRGLRGAKRGAGQFVSGH